ncbi:MAG TPA: RNA polymerase sigma factor [Phycisphaeraceae bacterium]|nr:RNA polymerase sigma factor [Phycisphaeraceae bacterium]
MPDQAQSNKTNPEWELMQRVAQQDPGSVEELYGRFGSLVYRMAYQTMPTRAEAEDAVQEVFIRLWRTAERFDPSKATLVTWVMLITRRYLVDRLRRIGARIQPHALAEGYNPPEVGREEMGAHLERREQYESLLKSVESLPELQRTVILRAYLGGQTLRQISEELGAPLGTIKSALSRALMRLRDQVAAEE